MNPSPEILIIDAMASMLEQTLHDASAYDNPYQARYTVDAVSLFTKHIIGIVRDDERLAAARPSVDRLITTGREVSAAVLRICQECNETHDGTGALCSYCQSESACQDPD